MSKLTGIKTGDVVKIKFKPIQDITHSMKKTKKLTYLGNYDIGANVNALVLGGDFVVVSADLNAKNVSDQHITIDNHYDGDTFDVYEDLIDTVEVIEVANKFISEEHGIIMIQVDNKIYINGELLSNNEDDIFLDDKNKGLLDKFKAFMEQYVVATAFEDCLDEGSTDEQ